MTHPSHSQHNNNVFVRNGGMSVLLSKSRIALIWCRPHHKGLGREVLFWVNDGSSDSRPSHPRALSDYSCGSLTAQRSSSIVSPERSEIECTYQKKNPLRNQERQYHDEIHSFRFAFAIIDAVSAILVRATQIPNDLFPSNLFHFGGGWRACVCCSHHGNRRGSCESHSTRDFEASLSGTPVRAIRTSLADRRHNRTTT